MMLNAFLAALAGILVIVGVVSVATKSKYNLFHIVIYPSKCKTAASSICGGFAVFFLFL